MVSKYLIGAAFLLAGASAENVFKGDDKEFEAALITKDKHYLEAKEIEKELKWEDALKTHSCCEEFPTLFMFTDRDHKHILCTKKVFKETDKDDDFKSEKWSVFEHEVTEIKETYHGKATHTHKKTVEKLLKALKDGQKEKVKEDDVKDKTLCAVGTPKKEEKKDEKKDEKKEEKKDEGKKVEYDWIYIIVDGKIDENKVGDKMTDIEILGDKFVGFCGTKKDVDEEVAKYSKKDEAGCCQCPCYVWIIVAIGVVAVGAGAWYMLKEDDVEEDEFANEYA